MVHLIREFQTPILIMSDLDFQKGISTLSNFMLNFMFNWIYLKFIVKQKVIFLSEKTELEDLYVV